MITYIALFRGINVGGRNKLPMKELIARLEDLGSQHVRTYIQSGNAVLQHNEKNAPRLAARISAEICESHGFEPEVILLKSDFLEQAVASNPFPEAESEPSKLHLFFPAAVVSKPDHDAIERLRAESERIVLKPSIVYLHAPDGIGRSRLAAGLEKALGVTATGRNWRTVNRILEMARRGG